MRAEGPLREVLRGVGEGIVKGYCSECQLASPPLAHHCRLCVACHHQTDHHCLFLNTCIAANNHWYFVVFIMTNIILMTGFLCAAYTATVPPGVQGDWVDRLTAHAFYLLNEDMWTVLMAVCNEASLIWAFYLLKWVYNSYFKSIITVLAWAWCSRLNLTWELYLLVLQKFTQDCLTN